MTEQPAETLAKPKTLDESILDTAGLEDPEDLLEFAGRISKFGVQGGPIWERGKSMPGDDNLVIHSMFGSASEGRRVQHVAYSLGDIRVYLYPKQSLPGDAFRRITISRLSPGWFIEPLTRESFVNEIARELMEIMDLEDNAPGDEECPKCGEAVSDDASFCAYCGEKLPEEPEGDDGEGDE